MSNYAFWQRGKRAELARMVDLHEAHLSEILHRKRGVDKYRAKKLEKASQKLLGYPIPWHEWLFNKATKHPAFFGRPTEGLK